jgi:membrane associated rhomboid family serine protease
MPFELPKKFSVTIFFVVVGLIWIIPYFTDSSLELSEALGLSLDGISRFQIWRLVSFVFVPPIWSNYIFWFLFMGTMVFWLGTKLEKTLGQRRVLLLYLAPMYAGGVCQVLLEFLGQAQPSVSFYGYSSVVWAVIFATPFFDISKRIRVGFALWGSYLLLSLAWKTFFKFPSWEVISIELPRLVVKFVEAATIISLSVYYRKKYCPNLPPINGGRVSH